MLDTAVLRATFPPTNDGKVWGDSVSALHAALDEIDRLRAESAAERAMRLASQAQLAERVEPVGIRDDG